MSNGSGKLPLSLLYFGMRCAFSGPPLAALLAAGYDVRAVVLPGAPFGPAVVHQSPAPLVPIAGRQNDDLDAIAQRAAVPIISVRDPRHLDAIAAIVSLRPAVIAVACFPWRLPRAILDLPPLGCLNVHPSLLPVGRGPEPLFWTFRHGERETGTTIHRMVARFDAGPIILQERIAVPAGIRAPDLERQLAEIGGRLLVDAIDQLAAGTAQPVPQDETRATTAPYPTDDDYLVSTDRPARWAFNFVRGVASLGRPLYLHVVDTGERFPLRDALDFTVNGRLDAPTQRDGNHLTVQFHPGTARFLLP
ncbi:MAG: methionyl-tRNA formyltransferase [Thermomicrobiales bacterium]